MGALEDIAKLHVKNQADVGKLIFLFDSYVQEKYPMIWQQSARNLPIVILGQSDLKVSDLPKPHDPKIPLLYKEFKNFAVSHGLQDLADAITVSAAWYHYNIEKPKSKDADLKNYALEEDNEIVKKEAKAKTRGNLIKWSLITASVLAGSAMLYFGVVKPVMESRKFKRKRSNPKRTQRQIRKDRITKHLRNNPSKSKNIPASKLLKGGSHLANYRNNYEKRKRGLRIKK